MFAETEAVWKVAVPMIVAALCSTSLVSVEAAAIVDSIISRDSESSVGKLIKRATSGSCENGNDFDCDYSSDKDSIIIGVVVAFGVMIMVVLITCYCVRRGGRMFANANYPTSQIVVTTNGYPANGNMQQAPPPYQQPQGQYINNPNGNYPQTYPQAYTQTYTQNALSDNPSGPSYQVKVDTVVSPGYPGQQPQQQYPPNQRRYSQMETTPQQQYYQPQQQQPQAQQQYNPYPQQTSPSSDAFSEQKGAEHSTLGKGEFREEKVADETPSNVGGSGSNDLPEEDAPPYEPISPVVGPSNYVREDESL